MKTTSGGLAAHLLQTVTTIATLWRITRTDGVELYFTDHDADITFDSNTYLAASGYKRTAITNNVSLSVDNVDVQGVFTEAGLTEEDLRVGLYDYADVRMMFINWADTSQGVLKEKRGKLGEVSATPQGYYQAELRGMSQLLSQNLVESYTSECRTDLGSTKCKIPIQPSVLGRAASVAVGEFYRIPTKNLTGVSWPGLGRNFGFELEATGLAKTSILGWTVTSGNWNIFSSDNGLSPDSGSRFLSGGTGSLCTMEQSITLESVGILTSEIDAGNATADFSIKRANQTTTLDTGRVIVTFRDADGAILGTALDTTAEAITPQDTWVSRGFTGTALPSGTRSIKVQLSCVNVGGGEMDTAFDNLQLTVHETARTNTFQDIYENRYYEVTVAGTTAGSQPSYDTTIGNPTTDGTATLVARDAWTRDAYINDVVDNRTFNLTVSDSRAINDWFTQGALIYESSQNSSKVHEIRDWTETNGVIVVFLPPPYTALPGSKMRVYPGCDKRLTICVSKFANALNFRGEPFIPGQDEFTRFADVR